MYSRHHVHVPVEDPGNKKGGGTPLFPENEGPGAQSKRAVIVTSIIVCLGSGKPWTGTRLHVSGVLPSADHV